MAVERLRAEEDLSKAARLPRWTRQELLVLIQGKRVAEGRVRRGRAGGVDSQAEAEAQAQVEPKWSSVSSYCKRHGVNRGPVQCRKRWSNLAGDFKKIKEWESQTKEEAESFWVMRNDLRRERKLPGFFDREVYDILDAPGDASLLLSLAPLSLAPLSHTASKEVVFDSGRPHDHALFSDDAMPSPTPHEAPTPISATQYEPQVPPPQVPPPPPPPPADKETSPAPEGRKRKRPDAPEDISLQKQLIQAMDRNARLLTSQLEIQNTNSHLDREQRKDHANTLFALLNKLADAMVTIADKL